MSHPVGVVTDIDHVAVMKNPVEQPGSRHLVAEDLSPFFEALV